MAYFLSNFALVRPQEGRRQMHYVRTVVDIDRLLGATVNQTNARFPRTRYVAVNSLERRRNSDVVTKS